MTLKAKDIREMTPEERKKKLAELKRALISYEVKKNRGALKETGKIRVVKRDIARILTVMRELGETE
ncbi:MAG: 50S ribosomal protein L29 [Candidatus Njordarchaeia archaeon]